MAPHFRLNVAAMVPAENNVSPGTSASHAAFLFAH
jgi:hypothetical protein